MSKGVGDVFGYIDKIKQMFQKDKYSGAILGLLALSGEFYPEYFMTLLYLFVLTFTIGKAFALFTHIVNWRGSNDYNRIINDQIQIEAEAENREHENHVRSQVINRKINAHERRQRIQTALVKKTIENSVSLGAINTAISDLDGIDDELEEIHQDIDVPFRSLLMMNDKYLLEQIPDAHEVMEEPRRFKKINEVEKDE
jgi:hypothetical protein